MGELLNVKPKSQLFPIPMVMGCEGTASSMLLNFYNKDINATTIMRKWPTHSDNPEKGYVGNHFLIKFGHHQTIFPNVLAEFLNRYDSEIIDGTGTDLEDLEKIIDKGHPVVIYHTTLGAKPIRKIFKIGDKGKSYVTNIHVTLLIGYDDEYYYYIDPLWKQILGYAYIPALWPSKYQIIKMKKNKMKISYNTPGKMCIYKKI
ncbi:C39 family peptidase [Mammaliicoccus sciuri]|uniref:C39 family peptidase n=1 Tax=Mammaliicoccus sciuri TaxID=1296 RepID=UPI003A905953